MPKVAQDRHCFKATPRVLPGAEGRHPRSSENAGKRLPINSCTIVSFKTTHRSQTLHITSICRAWICRAWIRCRYQDTGIGIPQSCQQAGLGQFSRFSDQRRNRFSFQTIPAPTRSRRSAASPATVVSSTTYSSRNFTLSENEYK